LKGPLCSSFIKERELDTKTRKNTHLNYWLRLRADWRVEPQVI